MNWFAVFKGARFFKIVEAESDRAALFAACKIKTITAYKILGPYDSFSEAKYASMRHCRELKTELVRSLYEIKALRRYE